MCVCVCVCVSDDNDDDDDDDDTGESNRPDCSLSFVSRRQHAGVCAHTDR